MDYGLIEEGVRSFLGLHYYSN